MTGIGLAVAMPAVMGYNWLTRANRVLTAKLDAFAFELLTFLSMGRALQGRHAAPSPAACRSAPSSTAGENAMAFGSFDRKNAVAADGRDQHGAVDRRRAGAAGDLHRHRAAADPRGQARPAQGDVAAPTSRSRRRSSSRSTPAARCSGTASASPARTPPAKLRRARARSGRSPRSTCAPTRACAYRYVAETLADASKAGLSKVAFVSEPAK